MNKKNLKILFNLLTIVLFIVLYTQLDWQSMMRNLMAVPVTTMLLLLALQLTDMFLVTYQHLRLSRHLGFPMSFGRMHFICSIGHIYDGITPGGGVGGEAVKIVKLRTHGNVPLSTGSAIVLTQKAVSASTLLMFCLCAFVYLTLTTEIALPLLLKAGICAILFLLIFLLLYAFYHPYGLMEKCKKIKQESVREAFVSFLEGIAQVGKNKKECFRLAVLALAVWVIYPFKLYLLLDVTGTQVGFLTVYAIIFLAHVMAMLPIFPGGMLGFEVTMTSLLTLYGIDAITGVFVTTLFRVVTFWFVIAFSLFYAGVFKIFIKLYKPKRNYLK